MAGTVEEEETTSFEVVVPLRGALRRHSGEGKSLVDAAIGYVAGPAMVQEIRHVSDGDRCVAVVPSERLADELGLDTWTSRWQVPVTHDLHASLASALATLESDDTLRTSEAWIAVLLAVRSGDDQNGVSPQRSSVVARVREVINADPGHPWTVPSLAALVGYQQHHLSRVFKAVMGVGLSDYRDRVRLGCAMALLRDGMSVTDVAHSLGYCDSGHLARRAKGVLGVSPSRLRR